MVREQVLPSPSEDSLNGVPTFFRTLDSEEFYVDGLTKFRHSVSGRRLVRQAVATPEETREWKRGKSGRLARDTMDANELGLSAVALRGTRVEEQIRARILERIEYEAKVRDLRKRAIKLYNQRKATNVPPIGDEAGREETANDTGLERALTVVAGVLLTSAAAVWWSGICASQFMHEIR